MPAPAAYSPPENKPNPDPSILTTQGQERGLLALREIIECRLHCLDEELAHVREKDKHRGEQIDKEVGHLRSLQNEQFKGIDVRFLERDTRTDKTAELNQKAIDAALQAAEKAVGKQNESFALATSKSEAAFAKQIDAISALITMTTKGFDDKIEDAKARLAVIEGRTAGIDSSRSTQREEKRDVVATGVGIIGIVVAVAAVIVAVITK